MATTTDLITKINENYGKMSKGQKLLANYIIVNDFEGELSITLF